MRFKAFISYSHLADDRRAQRLRHALHTIAKPWYRLRTMRVFLDETNLSASPRLWPDIEAALAQSEWFLLMASPAAARSEWIAREVEWWLKNRSADTLLLVKSAGVVAWSELADDFDWQLTDAVPRALSGAYGTEPLYIDLSWASGLTDLDLRNDKFRSAVLKITARLLGRSPDEIGGEDVRVHRRNVHAAWAAAALVTLAAVLAGWQAVVASRARDTALSRLLAARSLENTTGLRSHLSLALLQAVAANRLHETSEAKQSLFNALIQTNRVRRFVEAGDTVTASAMTRDGAIIATAAFNSARNGTNIVLWDTRTLAARKRLAGGNRALAFSPDDKLLASGGSKGEIVIFDLASGATVATLQGHESYVDGLRFSTDGRILVSSGINDDRIVVWDLQTRQQRMVLQNEHSVRTISLSPDNRTLASTSALNRAGEASIKLWDIDSGTLLVRLQGHHGWVTALAFSPDGKSLASGSTDMTVLIWDVERRTARALSRFHNNPIDALAFSPDGKRLLSGDRGGGLGSWSMESHALLESLLGHENGVQDISFDRTGKTAISSAFDSAFIVWDMGPGQQVMTLADREQFEGGDDVRAVAVSADGTMIAAGSDDKTVRLWDVESGEQRAMWREPGGKVWAVAFSPDGGMLAAGIEWKHEVVLYDTRSAKRIEALNSHANVLSLAFSPDGRLLAAATESSPSIYVWDTATGEEIASVDAHDGHPISVAFTPDGKHLVSDGSDQTVKVFDTATWKQQSMITGGFGVMGDIALSPAGTHVAFAGSGRVLLWRIGASRELQTLGPPNGSIRGMAAPEVAFSPDGKTVAYTDGEFDQTIVLWDSVARRIVTELQTSATVQSIAFLPGGKKLVSGHSSGEVMVWNVDTGTWLQRACERAGRNMTEEEWASTFGDELRYQESCPDYPGGQAASGEASGPEH